MYQLGQVVTDATSVAMLPDIGPLVTSGGVLGALIWYLYYNTSNTIPKLQEEYKESLLELAKQHERYLTDERERFAELMEREREYRAKEIELLKIYIKNEAACRFGAPCPKTETLLELQNIEARHKT